MTGRQFLFELLILDIETVPQVPNYDDLSAEWQDLWWKKVSKTVPETVTPAESYRQKAGILSEFGKIICISTAYFHEDTQGRLCLKMKSIYGDDEKELLEQFIAVADQFSKHYRNFQFAGHNIREFDIPYLCRRMLVHQIPLPKYFLLHDKKPWEVKMLDTLNWWKFGDNKHYTSLNLLAHTLGIPTSKTDMDGSMVQDVYYKEQDLNRIVQYCQLDVKVVADLILRFHNMPILDDEKVNVVT